MLSRTFTYQPHVQVVCIHIIYIMHISMISSPCTGALYMCISSTRTYQFHSRRYRPNLQIIHTYMSSTRTYHPRVHNNIIHAYITISFTRTCRLQSLFTPRHNCSVHRIIINMSSLHYRTLPLIPLSLPLRALPPPLHTNQHHWLGSQS